MLGFHLSYAQRVWFQVHPNGSFILNPALQVEAFYWSFLAKLR